jgi:hypothetical protein
VCSIELRASSLPQLSRLSRTNWQPQAGPERRPNMYHMLGLCGGRPGTCPVVGAGPRPDPTQTPDPGSGPGLGPGLAGSQSRPDPVPGDRAWVGTRDWTQTRQGWVPTPTRPPQTLTLGLGVWVGSGVN